MNIVTSTRQKKIIDLSIALANISALLMRAAIEIKDVANYDDNKNEAKKTRKGKNRGRKKKTTVSSSKKIYSKTKS